MSTNSQLHGHEVEKYTDQIYRAYEARLKAADLPQFDDADAVLTCADENPHFMDIIVQKFAQASRRSDLCDAQIVNEYLKDRPGLKQAVERVNKKRRILSRSKKLQGAVKRVTTSTRMAMTVRGKSLLDERCRHLGQLWKMQNV